MAVGAAVRAAGHGKVVHRAEAVEAGITADLVDRTAQDHLVFALQEGGQKERFTLFQRGLRSFTKSQFKGAELKDCVYTV